MPTSALVAVLWPLVLVGWPAGPGPLPTPPVCHNHSSPAGWHRHGVTRLPLEDTAAVVADALPATVALLDVAGGCLVTDAGQPGAWLGRLGPDAGGVVAWAPAAATWVCTVPVSREPAVRALLCDLAAFGTWSSTVREWTPAPASLGPALSVATLCAARERRVEAVW